MRPSWRVRGGHAGARRFRVLKVIVGLGNPGKQYEQTRHNVGWMVLDRLADRAGWGGTVKARDAAAVARGRYKGLDLVLVKPTTFMNESGIAVRKALARERAPLDDLLVVVDDFALPFGKLRMRERGTAGSHNGLRSIIGELGSEDFARLRVGIGEPSRNAIRHVLTRFSEDEREQLDHVLDAAADAVEDWARKGPSKASNRWNTWQLPADEAPAAGSSAQAGKSDPPTEGGIRRTRTGWRRLLPG
jgi:peptidyl-tRNA hydrolase, PTH1 family